MVKIGVLNVQRCKSALILVDLYILGSITMVTLKKITVDELYETIHSFVETNKVIIEDYEGMVNTVLRMIRQGYCFPIDRDVVRDCMECMTYMYAPSDDMNKERVVNQFMDDESDEEPEDEDFDNMDLMKMMQMMGGVVPQKPTTTVEDSETPDCEGCTDQECTDQGCKKVTTDEVVVKDDTTVIKEDVETVN